MFNLIAAILELAMKECVKISPTERPKTVEEMTNSVKTFFPALYRHIKKNHNEHDAELIMLISMSPLDYFYNHSKMLEVLEGRGLSRLPGCVVRQ